MYHTAYIICLAIWITFYLESVILHNSSKIVNHVDSLFSAAKPTFCKKLSLIQQLLLKEHMNNLG